MNATAHPTGTLGLSRVAPGLVGFLHFFTLGAALPLLPLYLKGTLGYSWTLTGVILTAIPFSLLIAQIFVRSLSQLGIDVRLGLAVSHLMAAGIAMAAAFRAELIADATSDWRYVFGFTVLYFSLLAPSMSWIARVGDAATSSGRSVVRLWRVWGTVGFIAPAWLCELVLVRFPNLVPLVESVSIGVVVSYLALLASDHGPSIPSAHPPSIEFKDFRSLLQPGTPKAGCSS